ncbi:MAG TPA: hypothetical protein VFM77_05065 [Terriglobales bacterium]|nr:hypothetical protein [Terriglobales bacterium]
MIGPSGDPKPETLTAEYAEIAEKHTKIVFSTFSAISAVKWIY